MEGAMWWEAVRGASLWAMALVPLFFLDAPFKTLRQRWVARLPHERTLLLSTELNFLALWALFKFYLKWDRGLLPAAAEPVLAVIGALLVAAGVALNVWGKLRLGRWFSATFGVKEGHELVADGPYALTRHPIYSGLLAMVYGSALAWDSALTLLLALLLTMTLFFHTVYEEMLFERHFGDAWRDYRRRVPRFLPFHAPGGKS
jgi:protein-S-isoprenylcysteine O-methyltransferase Ste14